jgi:gamma-glutamyltranspeptidase/glutathione hydrolase
MWMKKIMTAALIVLIFVSLHGMGIQKSQNLERNRRPWVESSRNDLLNSGGRLISTGPSQAVQVGTDILDRGGSAVDAALASALARITLDMGHIVSFAGIYEMVYYEASSGKVYSLNACFKIPLEEQNPLRIPESGIPNARGVMVPGFMAGVQAAHDRFGKLSFQDVFQPAIDLAENGFPLPGWQLNLIRDHWHVLGVLQETRNIFLKRRYGLFRGYEAGDIFIQPELAHTLRQVVSQRGEYMYTGDWGRHFVDIVRREGGNITLRDMEEYEPVWGDPLHTTFHGYDIHALGFPSLGAMTAVLGINLMECTNLAAFDHCSRSADALYRLMCCSRAGEFFKFPYASEIAKIHLPEGDFSYEALTKKETARLIWAKIESGEWPDIERHIAQAGHYPPGHSEAIIAADAEGNVAAVCHTINTDHWGNSGIFVDGVSVPAAGYFQQTRIQRAGPGAYLPDTTNPVLVLRNGIPAVASSCIGSDLHSATVQNLYNMLLFDMNMSQSRATGKFQSIDWSTLNLKVRRGAFSQSLIDAVQNMGLGITLVDNWASEYWIGMRLAPYVSQQSYATREVQR